MTNKPITGIDFSGAGDFYPKVNDETAMKLGELGWPNPSIEKANQPQRTWVGLTDEEKVALCKKFPDHLTFNSIEAIEAKLKEKNT